MHCADICLSATHNESARKLVMTQFEPCQYRHKSRYASVLQNRCFYTYIWLAYLVRFFERLLRQTTPKLLPLFECLPLLFLLMSLRYSVFPNIPVGNVPVISWNQGGPHYPFKLISRYSDFVQTTSAQTYWQNTQIGLDLASANAVYGGADTVQTASIRGSMLIRFE